MKLLTTLAARAVSRPLLLGVLACLLSMLAFGKLWDSVKEQGHLTTAFDRALLTFMFHHRVDWVTTLARGLAFLGSPPLIFALACLGTLAGFIWRPLRGAAWTLPLAIIGAGLLIQGIKIVFRRPRPVLFEPLIKESGYSFPSGHSLIAMVVYGLLGYFLLSLFKNHAARVTIAILTGLLIFCIGLSRVYVQVHYPTDVLAGWTVGFPWLLTCLALHERLTRRFAAAGQPVLTKETKAA